jgi:LuxR family maltose regulon positive regulatory protein
MAVVRLNWLGPPVVELDGHPLRLEMRKTLALLAYLSFCSQSPTRETLAALFWPEYDHRHAASNLRRNLSSLSKSLPFDLIEADREGIGLKRGAGLTVDVDDFHKQLTRAKHHSHPPDAACLKCINNMEEAVALYRGDFLEGFNLKGCPEFDEWQFFQRESLRSECANALQKVAAYYQQNVEWEKAIAHARSWLALDRLNEPAQRALIDLYNQSGQRNMALRQYDEYSRELKEQLGQSPEPETTMLVQHAPSKMNASFQGGSRSSPLFATVPLLKTKLYIPSAPSKRVGRNRLITLLEEYVARVLTLVSAPAGYGKTTLLAEWATFTQLPVAWVSLDISDNDPNRFFTYIAEAINSVYPGSGDHALELLRSPMPIPVTTVVSALLSDLCEVSEPFVLVLDDYHIITSHTVHNAIAYMLDHMPPVTHLVISTRTDPPLSLAWLRSRQQLAEIRTSHLRFYLDETTEFLNQIMELQLKEEDITSLESRTEGWIAGLKLAALSMQGRQDLPQFIRLFSGSHRYIMDYLVDEVLVRQPEDIQNFLMKTSILKRLCGPLCDALLDRTGSQTKLENLEKANLFLVSLDDERRWYRYHHLFANLLSSRLNHYLPPSDIRELHSRAASWFAQNNQSDHAMHHALIAGEYELAANIIEENALQMIGEGETITLMSWIANLPEDLVNERLPLIRFKIWGLGFAGKIDQAALLFPKIGEKLESQAQTKETQAIRGEIAIFRSVAANYHCQFQEAIDQCHKALALIPEESTRIRAIAIFALGDIYRAQGDMSRSYRAFVEAGWMAQEFGDFWTRIQSLWSRAVVREIQGQLHEAESLYQQAYHVAFEHGLHPGSVMMVDVGMSGLYYQWNRSDQAWGLLKGDVKNISWLDTMHWWENPNMLVLGYLILARLSKNSGDLRAAKVVIEKATQLCREFNVYPDIRSELQAELVRSWLERGDVAKATDWLEKYPFGNESPLQVWHECEDIACVRVLLALGRVDEAQSLLARLAVSAEGGERNKRLIEILILQALTFHATENDLKALDILRKALILSQAEGYLRIFLDEGNSILSLLIHCKEVGVWNPSPLKEYIDQLLNSFGGTKI